MYAQHASLSEGTREEGDRKLPQQVADVQEHLEGFLTIAGPRGNAVLTSIPSDGACKVCVNCAGQAVVSKSFLRHAPGAEIFCGQHATRSHDPDECVKCRLFGILKP